MPRTARVKKASDGIYHIIERGNEKKELFRDDEDRIKFLAIINRNQKRYGFIIYAYCLMSNHVHLLLGCNGCDISQVMKSINISYVSFFNRKYQRCGHLFQDRFKSEFVDDDVYAIELTRYIHLNPVRAGLVALETGSQYPWSSYHQYIHGEVQSQLSIDRNFILGMFSNVLSQAMRQYQGYVMRDDDYIAEREKTAPLEEAQVISEERYENEPDKILEKVMAEYGVSSPISKDIPIAVRNAMILTLRRKSQLTLKVIGEMFGGLSESMVSKILKNDCNSSQEPLLELVENRRE